MNSIEKYRLKTGKTQDALAKEVGVSRATWINWERGRTSPYGRYLKKLSDMIGVPSCLIAIETILESRRLIPESKEEAEKTIEELRKAWCAKYE